MGRTEYGSGGNEKDPISVLSSSKEISWDHVCPAKQIVLSISTRAFFLISYRDRVSWILA